MPRHPLADAFEVLVVDDEAGVRELISDYFASQGFTVTRATDGRGAILALERHPDRFGLVVTDLNMDGPDGFAVLFQARRGNPHCYVVIVTGYASLDSAIQAVRAGAYDYLPKPFALGQLDVILKRIADHASLDRAARRAMPTIRAVVTPSLALFDLPKKALAAPPAEPASPADRKALELNGRADRFEAPRSEAGRSEPGASPVASAAIEHRLSAIERALERIERRLAPAEESTRRQ